MARTEPAIGLDLAHALAPSARICFNSNPADVAEAVQREVKP